MEVLPVPGLPVIKQCRMGASTVCPSDLLAMSSASCLQTLRICTFTEFIPTSCPRSSSILLSASTSSGSVNGGLSSKSASSSASSSSKLLPPPARSAFGAPVSPRTCFFKYSALSMYSRHFARIVSCTDCARSYLTAMVNVSIAATYLVSASSYWPALSAVTASLARLIAFSRRSIEPILHVRCYLHLLPAPPVLKCPSTSTYSLLSADTL
mmetsp:Transcript_34452/g.85914  ORF Transcript_34452/g.85914 Transcript_34452/m.85914 type:complete len:211 (+) Transcript_34452:1393-2025(+)